MNKVFIPAFPRDPSYQATPLEAVCPFCEGRGFLGKDVPLGHRDFGLIIPCQCQMPKLLAELPDKTFANFHARPGMEAALIAAWALAEGEGPPWLILVSGPGTGKTHLAWAIVRRWLERGKNPQFWRVVDLLDWLREGIDAGNLQERSREIAAAPALTLDDFGMEKTESAWVQQELDRLVDARYIASLPTVFTANTLVLSRLQQDMPRIVSRWNDRAIAARPIITATDYRPFNA